MKNQFALIYRPARANFAEGQSGRESAAMQEHFNYLRDLLDRGILKLAGRMEDMSQGLAIVECASGEQARAIIEADPAVRSGVFIAECKPWRTALPPRD